MVVLDVAPRQLLDLLGLDAVDHGLEDLLPRRVLEPDRDHHHLALAVLLALVAEPDGRGLAALLQLIDEDRGVEVEDEHDRSSLASGGPSRPCGHVIRPRPVGRIGPAPPPPPRRRGSASTAPGARGQRGTRAPRPAPAARRAPRAAARRPSR